MTIQVVEIPSSWVAYGEANGQTFWFECEHRQIEWVPYLTFQGEKRETKVCLDCGEDL